jgi:hypothetical protein
MESELPMTTNTLFVGIFLAMLDHASAQPAIIGQQQDQTAVAGTSAVAS